MGGLAKPESESGPNLEAISARLQALRGTLAKHTSRVTRLRRWSEFIRERDGHRCVDCHSRERLAAHHISRKAFFETAQYQTGNGITLCRDCHKEVHGGFNGRPDLSLPVDAQGGEKLPLMERLYSILVDDATDRGLMCEDFYFLSNEVLRSFKTMQGYDPETQFPGSRVEQAYLILAETEHHVRSAVAAANGFRIPERPMLPGGMLLCLEEDEGRPSEQLLIPNYLARSSAS